MPQNIMAWFPARLKLGQYPGRKLERARTAFLLTFRSGEVTLGSPPLLLLWQATHPQPTTLLAMIRPPLQHCFTQRRQMLSDSTTEPACPSEAGCRASW